MSPTCSRYPVEIEGVIKSVTQVEAKRRERECRRETVETEEGTYDERSSEFGREKASTIVF